MGPSTPGAEEGDAYQLGQVGAVARSLEQALRHDKPPCQLLLLCLLLDHLLHLGLKVAHVAVTEPADVASRDLETLADRVVCGSVGDDDIATLAKGGDHAGDGGESLGIDDAAFGAEVGGDVGLRLHVDVLGCVELWWPARADAVGPQRLDRLLLDVVRRVEVVEVI